MKRNPQHWFLGLLRATEQSMFDLSDTKPLHKGKTKTLLVFREKHINIFISFFVWKIFSVFLGVKILLYFSTLKLFPFSFSPFAKERLSVYQSIQMIFIEIVINNNNIIFKDRSECVNVCPDGYFQNQTTRNQPKTKSELWKNSLPPKKHKLKNRKMRKIFK